VRRPATSKLDKRKFTKPKTSQDLLSAICEKIGGGKGKGLRERIEKMLGLFSSTLDWTEEVGESEWDYAFEHEMPEFVAISEMSDAAFAELMRGLRRTQVPRSRRYSQN